MTYSLFVGDRYDADRPLKDVKKAVIADLATAQSDGILPAGLSFIVTTKTDHGRHVNVTVTGLSDAQIYLKDDHGYNLYTVQAIAVRRAVEQIIAAYNRVHSDLTTDYYHPHLWVDVKIEDEESRTWRLNEERVARERRALRKALNDFGITGFKVSATGYRSGRPVAWTSLPIDEAPVALCTALAEAGYVIRTGAHTVSILAGETA